MSDDMRKIIAVSSCIILVAACHGPVEPTEELRLGWLYDPGSEAPGIIAPDTVRVDEPFIAETLTYGNDCHRAGTTEVELFPGDVFVRPYDYVDISREYCKRVLLLFRHQAEGYFAQEGAGRLTVLGWDPVAKDTVRLVKNIVVEPR